MDITLSRKKMTDYMLDGVDFSNITVLDAATGAGNTTLKLARKMAEANGKGKIVSVDIDHETFPDVKKKLGELARFVEFVQADLTCMPQIESESFDLVVCTATLCVLNDRPLKVLRGLTEFYRVLKKDASSSLQKSIHYLKLLNHRRKCKLCVGNCISLLQSSWMVSTGQRYILKTLNLLLSW